jgi:hypothetical protein
VNCFFGGQPAGLVHLYTALGEYAGKIWPEIPSDYPLNAFVGEHLGRLNSRSGLGFAEFVFQNFAIDYLFVGGFNYRERRSPANYSRYPVFKSALLGRYRYLHEITPAIFVNS